MAKTTAARAVIMIRKSIYCVVILAGLFNSVKGWSASQVPSLSVGDMIDVMNNAAIPRGAIRGQFLSELAQSYECTLQTRWYGLEVVTEKTINEMAYIDGLRLPENEIQAADYVICGNYANKGGGVQGYIFCTDLASDSRKKELSCSFETHDTLEIPAALAKETAKLLALASCNTNATAGVSMPKDLVWVVHPFLRCTRGWGVGSSMDGKLALQVEAELQQHGVVKKIVDRQTLDAILKEHNMANMPEQGFERVRMLSKLKKADILLTGQVAPWKKNNRIDLFLIDSRSGCLLSARTAKDVPEKDLASKCVQLAAQLAENPIVMPDIRHSSPAQRRREAETLVSRDHYPELFAKGGFYFTRVRSELESMINAAEGSYLLIHDDDAFVYKNIESLWSGYKRWGWWNTPRPGDNINRYEFKTLDCMQRTACLINRALQKTEHSALTPVPLLYRADALMYAGRYKEAIELAQSHLNKYPTIQKGWAQEILAQSHFKLGNMGLAEDFARQSIANQNIGWLTPNILADLNRLKVGNALKAVATTNDVTALAVYRKTMSIEGAYIGTKDWKRYLELLRAVEGPAKALDIHLFISEILREYAEKFLLKELPSQDIDAEKLMTFNITRDKDFLVLFPVAMLHISYCYAGMGEHEKAVRLCKNVIEYTGLWKYAFARNPFLKQTHDEAVQLCSRIEKEYGPVQELWKSGLEVKPLDERHCIYIVPLGSFDQGRLTATMAILSSFFGKEGVKLLPSLSTPKCLLGKGSYNYQCAPLFDDIFKSLIVPENALHVAIITDLPIENGGLLCAGQMENFNNPSVLSPSIISFAYVDGDLKIRDLSWRIISSFRYIYANNATALQMKWRSQYPGGNQIGYGRAKETCTSWTCIFRTELWETVSSQFSRLTMCPKCQQEYEKADFEKIHNDLIGYLKQKGVKIVKPQEIPSLVTAKKDESGRR